VASCELAPGHMLKVFWALPGHESTRTNVKDILGSTNNRLSIRSQSKMMNTSMNDLTMTEVKSKKELIESDKEERVDFEEALEDSNDKSLYDINSN
ncbi:14373_t:CDS:2, partial [Gigaspora margarita]